jgi:L-ascorbate metabolism protein UlaG (beta-lactamase superfamily)
MRRIGLIWMALAASAPAQVKVTYLANEGVLLTAGSTKVVVDALFRDSLGDYARHSATVQEQLEAGRAPFDGVSLALATHYHLDHWDAGAITRFLSSNPAAEFAGAPSATGMLPSGQQRRVRALWPADGSAAVEVGAVKVEAVPLVHGRVQNLAYRIGMGGRTLMHLGDAETTAENFGRLSSKPAPDVLLAPFWWLLDGAAREFLSDRWKPKAIVAIHFGANDAAVSAPRLRREIPQVWIAVTAGESRDY